MEMETKLDSRQGQFPASFPDTFKNFFAMMNEDEDHMDLFSNLLEDKVIPRANKFQQRRYGGSLRCTTNPHSRQGLDGERDGGLTSGSSSGTGHNVGRSNSFRFNRPRNAFSSSSSSGLNSLGIGGSGGGIGGGGVIGGERTCTTTLGNNKLSGSSSSLLCKHIKYCCLHQQQQQQQQQKNLTQTTLPPCNQQPQHHLQQHQPLFQQPPPTTHQQQPSIHFVQKSYHSDYTSNNSNNTCSNSNNCCNNHSTASTAAGTSCCTTRLGPDGEDNTASAMSNNGLSNCLANGQLHQHLHHHQQQHNHAHNQHHPVSSSSSSSSANSQQNKQPTQQQPQKRHSIILERAFDFDVSCDESDTISTTSSTPTTTNIPYNILKPILKQPQQQQQTSQIHVVQQNSSTTIQPKSILKDNSHQHQQQQQQQQQQLQQFQQQQQQQQQIHRTLPQPPKNAGLGAFHTKETALQRIQQQSGLIHGSRTNLSNLCGANPLGPITTATTINHYSSSTSQPPASATIYNNNNTSSSISNGAMGISNRSCSTFNMTTIGMGVGAACNSSNNPNGTFATGTGFMELHSPSHMPSGNMGGVGLISGHSFQKLNETLINTHANSLSTSSTRNNLQSIRTQKSPILNRRRSSSIVANLLTADFTYNQTSSTPPSSSSAAANMNDSSHVVGTLSHSNTRDRIALVKSPVTHSKPSRMNLIPVDTGGVLTFQQAMSGAVSPQYSAATSPLYAPNSLVGHLPTSSAATAAGTNTTSGGGVGVGTNTTELDMLLEDTTSSATSPTSTVCCGDGRPPNGPYVADTPTGDCASNAQVERGTGGLGLRTRNDHQFPHTAEGDLDSPTAVPHERIAGVGSSLIHGGSSATIAQLGSRQRQRMRTSSMPAESRKPRLADTRRQAIHCADLDLEYYRLRSFSITSHGVCNLGDSLRSRRSRSINSVTSTGTSNSGKDRHNSNASRTSGDILFESDKSGGVGGGGGIIGGKAQIPVYKIAMLGASGVGKTTLTYQFTTSDYICAYDLSLDDDYGQKTVSVLVDGIETDLEIIDHPACEMSAEAFCSTYNIDLFVVVYSVVDRSSFKQAEKILQYLKENEMLLTRGAILVGNKTDLERHREVNRQMARKLAKEIACKFIETSSGLDHNVDELLVGIVAQVKLNPQRLRNLSEKDRQRLNLQSTIQKHRRLYAPPRRMVRQMSMCQADGEDADYDDDEDDNDMGHDENQSNNIMMTGDEGIGTGSERTASTSLSSCGNVSKSCNSTNSTKGPVRKTTKRTLNLESILKMGESELEDEEEAQRMAASTQYNFKATRPISKFEMLSNNMKSSSTGRTPFGSVNSSPKSRKSYESSSGMGSSNTHDASTYRETQAEDSLLNDCNSKTVSKLTSRTKVFLSSVLRFKKAINVAKRRNSSSCSDLFVI